ncbi:hypothetical protein B7494_g3695 [Chlorociboria aeruginascens]|nr:hypothetical protein B7494_g3695 [Chlorociboria aeruginascens]
MANQPKLFAYSSIDALATTLRTYIIQAQNAGITRHDAFKVAVSGGSLPKTLAKALLAPPTSDDDKILFEKWEIFFADERAVPLDHEDSNYGLLKTELLDKIPETMGKPVVHPIDVKQLDDVQELADQYEQLLVRSFASRDSVKLPIFDLLLLGCGPDGHTCSLFPGHELLRETAAWVAPIEDSPKPPPKRITLTLPVVTHGVRVAFVATGAGKKEILKEIFEQGNGLPCALVNEGAGERCGFSVYKMQAPPMPPSLQSSLNATKVEYDQLGTSGLRVSSPILGTMGIGSKEWQGWTMDEEQGLQVLKAAWDRGFTTWDMANVYSSGINEEIIGKAIKRFGIPRQKLTILAKCMGTVPEEPGIFSWMFEPQLQKNKDHVDKGIEDESIIKRTQEIAKKKGWKMSQVALVWNRGKGCISVVGLNSTIIERMDEACAGRNMSLTEDEMKYLEEPYAPKSITGHV